MKNGMDADGTGCAGTLYRACSTGLQRFLVARLNTLADVDRNQRTAREAPVEMRFHDGRRTFHDGAGASTFLNEVELVKTMCRKDETMAPL